jgi:hypothetical protein
MKHPCLLSPRITHSNTHHKPTTALTCWSVSLECLLGFVIHFFISPLIHISKGTASASLALAYTLKVLLHHLPLHIVSKSPCLHSESLSTVCYTYQSFALAYTLKVSVQSVTHINPFITHHTSIMCSSWRVPH